MSVDYNPILYVGKSFGDTDEPDSVYFDILESIVSKI